MTAYVAFVVWRSASAFFSLRIDVIKQFLTTEIVPFLGPTPSTAKTWLLYSQGVNAFTSHNIVNIVIWQIFQDLHKDTSIIMNYVIAHLNSVPVKTNNYFNPRLSFLIITFFFKSHTLLSVATPQWQGNWWILLAHLKCWACGKSLKMSGSYSRHSCAVTLMKQGAGECDSAVAQLLAFLSLIPWHQHQWGWVHWTLWSRDHTLSLWGWLPRATA